MKNVNQQLLSVILFEDELQVKFATRFDLHFLASQIVHVHISGVAVHINFVIALVNGIHYL